MIMKDCRLCKYLLKTFYMKCSLGHELEFDDGCKKCGIPYMHRAYWNQDIKECPNRKEKLYEKDPYG